MELAIRLLWLSLLCICSHARLPPGSRSSSNATTDELALLSFKSMLSSPSWGLLASWNTSSHFCSWAGVSCSRRHHERVVSLLMNSFNLSGRISPCLGNLSFLRAVDLGGNQLVGEIPAEVSHLIRLQVLNLSSNQLQEYGAGNVVSTNGDIYSYGILVLEMVTGKRPTDSTFREGSSIREYVELALHRGTMEVIDMHLSLSLNNELQVQGAGEGDYLHKRKTDCLISLLRLGLSCSSELPSSRMPTGDIIKELLAIRASLI
ncbi:unnamed protein product [Urochloa humidicola]